MPTPEQLSAEKRKKVKVAEYVTGRECTWEDGLVYIIGGFLNCRFFRPDSDADHWQALVIKVAQMIEEAEQCEGYIGYHNLSKRFNKALAENNTPQIEDLAFELIEGGKDD